MLFFYQRLVNAAKNLKCVNFTLQEEDSSCHNLEIHQSQILPQEHQSSNTSFANYNLQDALDASLEALAAISCRSNSPQNSDSNDVHNGFVSSQQLQQQPQQHLTTITTTTTYLVNNSSLESFSQSPYTALSSSSVIQSHSPPPGSIANQQDLINSNLDLFKQEFNQTQYVTVGSLSPPHANYMVKSEFDEFAQSQYNDSTSSSSTTTSTTPTPFPIETYSTLKCVSPSPPSPPTTSSAPATSFLRQALLASTTALAKMRTSMTCSVANIKTEQEMNFGSQGANNNSSQNGEFSSPAPAVHQDEPFANIEAPTDMDYLDIDTLVNNAVERHQAGLTNTHQQQQQSHQQMMDDTSLLSPSPMQTVPENECLGSNLMQMDQSVFQTSMMDTSKPLITVNNSPFTVSLPTEPLSRSQIAISQLNSGSSPSSLLGHHGGCHPSNTVAIVPQSTIIQLPSANMKVEVEVLDHIFRQENSLINGSLSHQRHASAPATSLTLQPGNSLPPRAPGKLGNAKNYRYI